MTNSPMTALNKQAYRADGGDIGSGRLKEIAGNAYGDEEKRWMAQRVLSLLDENLQLQRDKDSLEAVAIAMRDDMREAREKLEAAEKRIAELERSEAQLINERDDSESALNDAYKAVMGQAPEWSNWFSFADAIDEIELACKLWRNQTEDVIQFRQRIAELQIARDKCFLSGLKTGWEYGIADDTDGFNREVADAEAVIDRAAGIGVKGE
ncbi:ead/Ea22-like family protein [Citrobacter braakii]|uniref:ead/Ea22-like family protein n=1 Tax=Citrobacter braakii TaxID=57706 RepID=UPI0021AE26E2|nr:ead/Ea22-like family protein [Citrobacter braakii]